MAWCDHCRVPWNGEGTVHDPGCPHAPKKRTRPKSTNVVRIPHGNGGVLRINALLDPIAKPRMTARDKHRPAHQKYFAWKDKLAGVCSTYGYSEDMDVYRIDVIAWMPMFMSWSNKKKVAMNGQPHRQKPDADNILKAVCDTLLGDDSKVWLKTVEKRWNTIGCLDIAVYYTTEE